ncbi:TPA: hypothetical protein DF272_06925 [Candidatus Falkowbacteria bacterium]|nr:hypothetical protein [Candidatus Falkowbacteria bacterium]
MSKLKVFLHIDPYLPESKISNTLMAIAQQFSVVPEPESAEMVIVLGGDGAMLDAIRDHHHQALPFFGINFGHVGFLLNAVPDGGDLGQMVETSEFIEFPLMDIEILLETSEVIRTFAFNEVYTHPYPGHTCCHRVMINGDNLMDEFGETEFRGNGIIYATPGGCTSYNYNARGVYALPDQGQFVLTPVDPIRPNFHRFHSRAICDTTRVTVELLERHRRKQFIIADTQVFENAVSATMVRAEKTVGLKFGRRTHYFEKVIRLFSYNGR